MSFVTKFKFTTNNHLLLCRWLTPLLSAETHPPCLSHLNPAANHSLEFHFWNQPFNYLKHWLLFQFLLIVPPAKASRFKSLVILDASSSHPNTTKYCHCSFYHDSQSTALTTWPTANNRSPGPLTPVASSYNSPLPADTVLTPNPAQAFKGLDLTYHTGLSLVAQTVKNLPTKWEIHVWSLGQEYALEKGMQPTPVFLLGESHGQRSLASYNPWGHKQSDTTEELTILTYHSSDNFIFHQPPAAKLI